jgi:DNA-binding NtrC family response regulator
MSKILVLDDNKGVCNLIEEIFRMEGHEVRSYTDIAHFMQEIENFAPDVGIFDLTMSKDMIRIVNKIKKFYPNMKVIIMSADEPEQPLINLSFISKPFDILELKKLVYESLKQEMAV